MADGGKLSSAGQHERRRRRRERRRAADRRARAARRSRRAGRPGDRRARSGSAQDVAGALARPHRAARCSGASTADLDDRDPDYIRENLSLSWLDRQPLVPGRGPQPRQHPRAGPGAPGGQPHRRQPLARDDHLHARVLDLLRRRAPLPPARAQPRARVAARPVPAQLRDRRRLARERAQGARGRRRRARLPRRRLGGAPAELAEREDRLRRPQGLRAPRARAGRPDRPRGDDRRPGDRALARSRRLAGEAAAPRPDAPPQGPADPDRPALGPRRSATSCRGSRCPRR